MPLRKLSGKQSEFVDAYIGPAAGNCTQAALIAGYPAKSAGSVGCENLKKPSIIAAIKRRQEILKAKNGILTPEEILSGYSRDITFDVRRLVDDTGRVKNVNELDDVAATTVTSFRVKETISDSNDGSASVLHRDVEYKLSDRKASRDSLGKALGIFTEKIDLTTDGKALVEKMSNEELLKKMSEIVKQEA